MSKDIDKNYTELERALMEHPFIRVVRERTGEVQVDLFPGTRID